MSSSQPNSYSCFTNLGNNGGMPMFAPATTQQHPQQPQDEPLADLGDLFSDYFLHEYDETGNLGNYSAMLVAAAAAQQQHNQQQQQSHQQQHHPQQQQPQPFLLPTGRGIMTPYHFGALPLLPAAAAHKFAVAAATQQQKQQQQQQLPPPPQDISQQQYALTQQYAPVAKKHRGGITLGDTPYLQDEQRQLIAAHTSALANAAAAAARQPDTTPTIPTATATTTKVVLPVGHGIRIGGTMNPAPDNITNNITIVPLETAPKPQPAVIDVNQMDTGLTHKEVEDRRLRNREHAKRSRVRKKFILEALQQDVKDLQGENQRLLRIVQEHIPQKAQQIITECCADNNNNNNNDQQAEDDEQQLTQPDLLLIQTVKRGQQNFVLTDPTLPDNPIVFASPGFLELTGYSRDEVLGRNCRFLQGPGTDAQAVQILRKAIETGSETCVTFLNYTADGTPFWNELFIAPLRDQDGTIVNFIGVQCKLEPAADSGLLALEEKVNAIIPLPTKSEENTCKGDDEEKS